MLKHSSTMKILVLVVVLALAATSFSVAIPKPDEKKNQVVEEDLSDVEDDHEDFVGQEQAEIMSHEDLNSEQSRERLKIIYDKIDKDQDSFVTKAELCAWIKHIKDGYMYTVTNREWVEFNLENSEELTWDKYSSMRFTGREEYDTDFDEKIQLRDKKRWGKADLDENSNLSKEEYTAFRHPGNSDHMLDVFVEETAEDIDTNNDGAISLIEYVEDMWTSEDQMEETEEPEWVKIKREEFTNVHDKNKDGIIDKDEAFDMISKEQKDPQIEANDLMKLSDTDGDGKLTKEEVVEKHDLFVQSEATDFGEALTNHDEL